MKLPLVLFFFFEKNVNAYHLAVFVFQVTMEEPLHMDLFDQSSGEPLPLPSQDFIEERRAYFAEIDAFEMVEEFVSSGSDSQ
jgi:hypothetical protein